MSDGEIKLQPREKHTPQLTNVLHSPKRIRVKFGGEVIADSRETLILRSNQFLPTYFFPIAAVRKEFLVAETRATHEPGGEIERWGLKVEGRSVDNAAWSFLGTEDDELRQLIGYVAFRWKAVDSWYEEEEEIFVHPRDPYARVDTLQSSSHVQVLLDGQIIADSKRPVLLFETHLPTRYYVAPEDVRLDLLTVSATASRCPYKGIASYWSATLPTGTAHPDIAWSYEDPLPEIPKIKGLIAFYPNAVEIRLDGERVS